MEPYLQTCPGKLVTFDEVITPQISVSNDKCFFLDRIT